jgi:hypothetical protein
MPNIAHDAIRTSVARPLRLYSSNVLEEDFSDVRSCKHNKVSNSDVHPLELIHDSPGIHRRLLSCGGWNPEEGGNYGKTKATVTNRNKQLSGQTSVIPFNRRRTPMPIRFFRTSVTVPPGTGRRTISDSVDFTSNVMRAGVALEGFALDFVGNVDRHINVVEVDVDMGLPLGTTVPFTVECEYKDATVDPDDAYQGYVSVLVIAEVA